MTQPGARPASTSTTTAEVEPARTYPARRVYSVVGVPPEIQAYALAKYSRSSQGMLESIQELSAQRAEQFLTTFYFQYGHRSIADLAHLVFGLEQISVLAAMAVVDEPVWDGQERSTRYQPFRKTGWHLPDDVRQAPAAASLFRSTAEGLFAGYESLSAALLDHLADAVARPDAMPEATFRRTLRARAFDVARALLPLATHTSVGQIVSARVLERQIGRLLGSSQAELRAIGQELKQSCMVPAEAPLSERSSDPAAPTLVKYADASPYPADVQTALEQAATTYLAGVGAPEQTLAVSLATPTTDPQREIAATLLYRHDRLGHSYAQVQSAIDVLSDSQVEEIVDLSLAGRGRHDDLLREHRAGYGLIFDVLVDLGSFRDLHRHRRCVQIQQPLTWDHGFDAPEDVFTAGLGATAGLAALEAGLGDLYVESLHKAERAASVVAESAPGAAEYLLPLAYRTRCLFKMDWAEAAYIIEQRTQPQGHFSYKRIAWGMYEALRARHPRLANAIRAVDPHAPFDVLTR